MAHDSRRRRQMLATLALLACGLIPDQFAGAGPSRLRATLASGMFNRSDASRIERGYYERLLDTGPRLDDLGDLPALRGRRRAGVAFASPVDAGPLVVRVADLREVTLEPGGRIERSGILWSTNAQGMRDREYPVARKAGTFRIALVGDSIAAGLGVAVERRFEAILEREWDERSRRAGGPAVEILDTAVPAHAPGQRWHQFQQVGWPMRPDLVICESSEADLGWDERRLRFVLSRGQGFDSPLYRDALAALGVQPGWSPEEYKHALHDHHRRILAGVYHAMVVDGEAHGVPIIWALIPRVGQSSDPAHRDALVAMARSAGFARVVDASDAYNGLDPAGLAVEPDDFHPNDLGHERLARRLDEILAPLPELRQLWSRPLGSPAVPDRPRTVTTDRNDSRPRGVPHP